jgi:hypothetical protein
VFLELNLIFKNQEGEINMAQKNNLKIQCEFSRLIRFVKDGEIYRSSIIAINKYDWEVTNGKVSKRKYQIYINLWLVQFYISFILPVNQSK